MREFRPYGSVRGARSDVRPYRDLLSVDMPCELTLTPRNMLVLQGTGTSFDQSYFVASIERTIAFDNGCTQSLRLTMPLAFVPGCG
jgi:hypothetical protein